MKVLCSKCGTFLWEWPQAETREYLCERCGGTPPTAEVTAQDEATALEVRTKLDERADSGRAPFRETVLKDEITRDTGRRSDRRYVVDRVDGVYEETVVDQETGVVIYHKRQTLKDKNRPDPEGGTPSDAA